MFHNQKRRLPAIITLIAGMVVGCSNETPNADRVPGRWYTAGQVTQGSALFLVHCASCHGEFAEGTVDWRKTDANGNYPPPPLDGTAHTWHHPSQILERTIAVGGAPFGGVMPGFAEMLSEDEARAIVAYFHSFWPDGTYDRWQEIGSR